MANTKRKVCFVITSFIHYSRNFLILEELKKRKDVELYIAVGGSALLSRSISKFARIKSLLGAEGYKNIHEVFFNVEGDALVVKAKTAGLGIVEFASLFSEIKPDLVVVRGDRFEVLSAVTAAAYMNISVAHIEGGDVSGTLDESVRHAITKLSHIHFATNEPALKRIVQMGEDKNYAFNFGSPDIEVVKKIVLKSKLQSVSETGSGADVDVKKDYLIVLYHPVHTDISKLRAQTNVLINAVHDSGIPALWFWPNEDAGAEEISHELRKFNDEVISHKIRFMRYMPPEKFIPLLSRAKCLIGNSSAGLKECSYLGVPVVNIGSRQNNRLQAKNVKNVSYDYIEIKKAIDYQVRVGKYTSSDLYFSKNTSKNIAIKLATLPLYTQKKFV